MIPAELIELVRSVRLPGWRFNSDGSKVWLEMMMPPFDSRGPGRVLPHIYFKEFVVPPASTAEQVVRRIFAIIQFLQDHELREQFLVGGVRWFEPHTDPPITGHQWDWFVEQQSAVNGY